MVHRLRGGQLRDRRHHAIGVGGEHHEILRHAGAAAARRVRDEFERIGGARVLGLRLVVEIDEARLGIEADILQHRAEAQRRVVDLGLGLARELDGLGVAAALEVEHAARAPAVLVVADQRAVRIGRERGLAGAGQAEEQRDVAVLADIGRAVHRHHAFGRQVIVERREHRLLHLAGIEAAADQDHAPGQVERDHRLRAHAVLLRVGLEGRQAEDGEIRHIAGKLAPLRADQQRADEQRVPRQLGEHARLDAVFRIGAAIKVLAEELLALGVLEEIVEQDVELLRRQLAVLLPPDRLLGRLVANDVLVLRRAAGVDTGLGAECAALDDVALVPANRVLIELLGRQIPMDAGQILQAELVRAMGAIPKTRLFHARPPPTHPARRRASGRLVNARRPVRVRPRPGPIMAILTHAKAPWRRKNGRPLEC